MLNRMGFSKKNKHKNKQIKHFSEDNEKIADNITKYKIPNELLISWDQTAVNIIAANGQCTKAVIFTNYWMIGKTSFNENFILVDH